MLITKQSPYLRFPVAKAIGLVPMCIPDDKPTGKAFFMKTYAEKLRDPRWQKKRLEIMGRDEFTCQGCGDTKNMLSVHHTAYTKGKEPWEYDDILLVTLCERCHEINHSMYNDQFNSLKDFAKIHGFTYHDCDQIAKFIETFSKHLPKFRKKNVSELREAMEWFAEFIINKHKNE